MTRRLALGLMLAFALAHAWAIDPLPVSGEGIPEEKELTAIRELLVALEIEKAQAALDAILGRPELPEETRVEALELKAQAHVASDDLVAAEKDYRALLGLRAGYVPDREVTSKRAMDRFLKIQASMIGTIRLELDPKDASLAVDGRAIALSLDGRVPAEAGDRRLRITRKGFDAQDVDVNVVAGKEAEVAVRLVPNARSLVVRTDVDGVAVSLDGAEVGVTVRGGDAASDANAPAVLLIEDVMLGEHDVRLAKPCFGTESLTETVSVDLADRSPKVLRVVEMRPARTTVAVTGGSYDGELFVDRESVATLPLTTFTMCPGQRTVEVVASGRIVWAGVLDADESELALDLSPRPSAALVGAAWPKPWAAAAASWSLLRRVEAPAGVDLTTPDGWREVALPPDVDLAVGVTAGAGLGGVERVVAYSPALRKVEDRGTPPDPSPPRFRVAALGAVLVDSRDGGVLLMATSAAGPAARAGILPGDRLVAIAGRPVENAASARELIAASEIGETRILDIAPPRGPVRKVECVLAAEPSWGPLSGEDQSPVIRAAWALVSSAAGRPGAAEALASLAIMLEMSGQPASALEAWSKVRKMGSGPLAARAAYALGAALQAKGQREEAIEAFGQASTEGARSGDLALAAAATDRLADLGVAPR